jgi:hypothetical protein
MYLTAAAARPSLSTPARLDHFACQLTGQDWPEEEESLSGPFHKTQVFPSFLPPQPNHHPSFLPPSPPNAVEDSDRYICTGRRQKVQRNYRSSDKPFPILCHVHVSFFSKEVHSPHPLGLLLRSLLLLSLLPSTLSSPTLPLSSQPFNLVQKTLRQINTYHRRQSVFSHSSPSQYWFGFDNQLHDTTRLFDSPIFLRLSPSRLLRPANY